MLPRTLDALRRQEGQALVEYSMVLVFISILAIAGLRAIGLDLGSAFEAVIAAFR